MLEIPSTTRLPLRIVFRLPVATLTRSNRHLFFCFPTLEWYLLMKPMFSSIPDSCIQLASLRIPDVAHWLFPDLVSTNYRIERPRPFDLKKIGDRISVAELEILNNFRTLKKQIEWLCGRLCVKALVGRYVSSGMPAPHVRVATTTEGAPYLSGFPEYSISITHGGDWAVAALAERKDVCIGIDIEPDIQRDRDAFLRTAVSERERSLLESRPESDLTSHWTRKEAALKLIGKGFHLSLKKLEVLSDGTYLEGDRIEGLNEWTTTCLEDHILSAVWTDSPLP